MCTGNENPSVYQFAIANVKKYIRSEENKTDAFAGKAITAFDAATVLAIAFMKDQNDVMADLVK